MPRSCRLFLAIDLPAEVRATLAALARPGDDPPDGDLPGARWVAPAQMHLTLRFLGGVPETEIDRLRTALAGVRAPRFPLALAGMGTFPAPPTRSPRVLWAAVAPVVPVRDLKRAIDEALGPDPEAHDRPFSPHVTLARWQDGPGARPGAPLDRFLARHQGLHCAPFEVGAFRLYESRTLPQGPQYTALTDFPLFP